jgi:hypothetical protein
VIEVVVEPGQTWSYEEPNGAVRTFEIVCIMRGPNGRPTARGRTASGKVVMCPVSRLAKGLFKATLVRPAPVRSTG